MKYFLFVIFWISLKAVSPKCRPNQDLNLSQDLHTVTKITAKLTDESQKNLQILVKKKLVENRQIPETASINIESIYLDKSHRDIFAGQGYTVKSLATWTAFFPHRCKVGLYILKMNNHNEYFTTQLFDSNLVEAKVDLPK
jgi:hypothetical protein